MRTWCKKILLILLLFNFELALAFNGSPGGPSGPPSPPGEGDEGALVRDVNEVSLETPWFLFFVAIVLFYLYHKRFLIRKTIHP